MKSYAIAFEKGHSQKAIDFVKWCRRNFGERGAGWDFVYAGGTLHLNLWEPKFITMYVLFKQSD